MNIKNLLELIAHDFSIGGLEITDLGLRFVQIKGGSTSSYYLKLEQGVVKDGKIQDKEKFLSSLISLRNQIANQISLSKNKKIYAVVNIPDNNVYVQMFNLPQVASANFEEAVQLNLRMISPIDFDNAYSDWQLLNAKGAQLELLGAFAQKAIIDEIENLLKESGFIPAAIEFPGISIARLIADLGEDIDVQKAYIIMHIGANGLSFNLVKGGNLYFNHFVSWQSVYEDKRVVPFDSFKELVVEEIKRVSSFYANHWGGQIEDFILITYGLEQDIIKIIAQNFSFKIKQFSVKKYKEIGASYYNVLGSALRGEIARSKDNFISLASIGTEKEFDEQRIFDFIKIWRNVFASALLIMAAIFGLTDAFLIKITKSLEAQISLTINRSSDDDVKKLQEEAERFNKKIDIISKAYGQQSNWSAFLEKINNFANAANVKILRIYNQSMSEPITINASAASDSAATDFERILKNDSQFSDVVLPLDKISQTKSGFDFSVVLKVKK